MPFRGSSSKAASTQTARALLVATALLATHALGCGGRAYDVSNRTISCGRGGFGAQCVARGINARSARVRACYESELPYAPTLTGQITVELTVEEDGETTGVHASDDTLGNATVRECVLSAIDDMRFAPGSTGGPTTHSFPLVFEPRQR